MQPQLVFEFWRRANRERMPFVARDFRYLYENVIARTKFEIRRSGDDQLSDLKHNNKKHFECLKSYADYINKIKPKKEF